jgi:2-C-methyl-D-erythritol 4-phosphate cytidylyltransferase
VDSIRIETVGGSEIIDRNKVKIIQTPQTFYSDIVKAAYEQEYEQSFTDEASVVERLGVKIHLVEGEASNIKITRPIDLLIAEKILEERQFSAG